jgi:PleD family two-component response regulator
MALVTPEIFEFVLANELKRALRSQNFLTLALIHPRDGEPDAAVREIASLVTRELRETDLLATGAGVVSLVLLDADLQSAMRVIERVMARLEHYQFTVPLHIEVGAACCPTHGADVDTLRRVATEARTGLTRRTTGGPAPAQ